MANHLQVQKTYDLPAKLYPNSFRAFKYRQNEDVGGFEIPARNLNPLGGAFQAIQHGKLVRGQRDYGNGARPSALYRDLSVGGNATIRGEPLVERTKKHEIDSHSVEKSVTNFLAPTNRIDSVFGDYDGKPTMFAFDLPYAGSDGIMGQRKAPMLHSYDITYQRPEHENTGKSVGALERYADSLLANRPQDPEMKSAIYRYIAQIAGKDSNMLRKMTVMEMRALVFRFIQNFRPGQRRVTQMILQNTM